MKKNIFIVILVLIVLGLGGYLVYDKVIDKEKKESKVETKNEIKISVIDTFNKKMNTDWPTEIGHIDGDPNSTVKSVKLPKINSTKENAKNLNNQIYNDYSKYTKMFDQGYKFELFDLATDITIEYNSIIKDNVIYIVVTQTLHNYRGSGSTSYKGYYYDINNDKILTEEEINNKYNIKASDISGAKEITAVLPTKENKYNIYYIDNDIGNSNYIEKTID